LFGNEIAYVFYLKHKCNLFGKEKNIINCYGFHSIFAFETQREEKHDRAALHE
jgi:hypothetical protein